MATMKWDSWEFLISNFLISVFQRWIISVPLSFEDILHFRGWKSRISKEWKDRYFHFFFFFVEDKKGRLVFRLLKNGNVLFWKMGRSLFYFILFFKERSIPSFE